MQPRAPGPGCAAARSSSGGWSTSPPPGDSCRASIRQRSVPLAGAAPADSPRLALLIGLPIVLVLAWYHGDRGQQRVSTPEFAILTLLLLLGGGAFWYYQRASDADSAAAANAGSKQSTAAPGAAVLRLAVLPLENLSPDPANAFFADGLHDEILSAMSATPDLQVVSRTTMRTYAGTRKTVKQIAAELGASHLLEGAVRRAGEKVRLTLQLIDAASDSNVWSRTFDRQLSDALSLQSEVAMEVATALDVRLLPANANDGVPGATNKSVPTNPIAYDLYLKGKVQLASFSQLDGPRAFDRLEGLVTRAIEIDPGFASSYTLRARALLWRLWYLCDLTDEQWQMIGSDIESAKRLAGNTADVLAAQSAFEYYGKMDYPHALEATRAALGQYPNDLDLRELEGFCFAGSGGGMIPSLYSAHLLIANRQMPTTWEGLRSHWCSCASTVKCSVR